MKKILLSILILSIMMLPITGCTNSNNDANGTSEVQEITNNTDIVKIIDSIVSSGPQISSNPHDYIKTSQIEYDKLLKIPKETFEYAITDLINSNANEGLTSYIEALLCSEINKNFKYNFSSASDYLEHYKKFLTECDCIYNEYDEFAKSLLK